MDPTRDGLPKPGRLTEFFTWTETWHIKYLGIKQHFRHGDTKATCDQIDLSQTVSKIILSGLDSKTTVGILNSCVAGKARYYLATGLWTKNQAEIKLERRFRNKLSETGFHYRAAALERLYLPQRLLPILFPNGFGKLHGNLINDTGYRRWYPAPGRL